MASQNIPAFLPTIEHGCVYSSPQASRVSIDYRTALRQAIATAQEDCQIAPFDAKKVVIWCDGSQRKHDLPHVEHGAGVVWRRSSGGANWWWRQRAYCMDLPNLEAEDPELFGLQQALEVALDEAAARIQPQHGSETHTGTLLEQVRIYTDSKSALRTVEQFLEGSSLYLGFLKLAHPLRYRMCQQIERCIYRLEKMFFIRLQLSWVPAHAGVSGNEMADLVAKVATREKIKRDEQEKPESQAFASPDQGCPVRETFAVQLDEGGNFVATPTEVVYEDVTLLGILTGIRAKYLPTSRLEQQRDDHERTSIGVEPSREVQMVKAEEG